MAYRRPGIISREVSKPTVTTITGIETTVMLLGEIEGATPATDSLQMSGVTSQLLTNEYVAEDTISVIKSSEELCILDLDYTVSSLNDSTSITRKALTVPNASISASSPAGGYLLPEEYFYQVSAYNVNGETIASEEVNITVSGSESTVTLDWGDVTGAVGYKIYRGITPGGELYLDSAIVSTYTDDGSTQPGTSVSLLIDRTSKILDSESVNVSYDYSDPEVYEVKTFYDYDDVKAEYGSAFNTITGVMENPLVFGAELAFKNGAMIVKTLAIDPDPENVGSSTVDVGDYSYAIENRATQEDKDILVVLSTSSSLHGTIKSHVNTVSNAGEECIALIGTNITDSATLITYATGLNDKRCVLVVPGSVNIYNGFTNSIEAVDSTFVAAALSGILSSSQIQAPITNRRITGFDSLPAASKYAESQKNSLATNGCLIIESRGSALVVRHGLTSNTTTLESQEISVVRETDYMLSTLRSSLQSIFIGGVIDPTTVSSIRAVSESILDSLVSDNAIYGYKDLKVRQNPDTSTQIDVKFAFQPIYPLNYLVIEFNFDMISG